MKTKICIIIVLTILIGVCPAQADTVWLSGHHEIIDGDLYGEIYIYNDVTLDMFGGEVYKLETFNVSAFDMLNGQMDMLLAWDDSTVDIFGGDLGVLLSAESSSVYLYAYDVIYSPDGGDWSGGQLMGKYYSDDTLFSVDLMSPETYSHITVIPVIYAKIEIKPNTLNLSSKGRWITSCIWLPEGYNVANIEPNSVVIENEPNDIYPDWIWFEEQEQVAMAKFPRSEVQDIIEPGEVELTISGELIDGTRFEGSDTIRVIRRGRKKN